uniref:Uncharacterized protein n=1 Tax=Helianthus annuus TaxID=4232 RepID=A0A251V7I4_HELAN
METFLCDNTLRGTQPRQLGSSRNLHRRLWEWVQHSNDLFDFYFTYKKVLPVDNGDCGSRRRRLKCIQFR